MENDDKPKPLPNLLPCPFCGSADVHVTRDEYCNYVVECVGCSACGPVEIYNREDEAINAWNRRGILGRLLNIR